MTAHTTPGSLAVALMTDAFGRVKEHVHEAVDVPEDVLTARPAPEANTIAWLVWHLTRVADDHLAHVAGRPQVWTQDGWSARFGLPFEDGDIGYGQSSDQVGHVVASADLLTGYHDAVHARTMEILAALTDDDWDRVVDTRWDPPVTLAVRLVSVLDDCVQHAGQAAYARGILLA